MHYPCNITHALSMHPNLSCHPQEYKHALSMQCHTCIIHASTPMHYPCIHIRLVVHKSTHALLSMHSYPCILIHAISFVHCHSSCYLQDHKHTITIILLCTRPQFHRSNIIKCPLQGSMYSKPHAYNIISMQCIASKACLSTT